MPKREHQHVVFKEPARAAKKQRQTKEQEDESKKYWFSTRDIAKFAADGSDRKTKKKYELFQLMKAGALPAKTLKTPLPILRGMRQKHGERMKRKREEEVEMGTFDKKKHLQQEQSFARMDPLASVHGVIRRAFVMPRDLFLTDCGAITGARARTGTRCSSSRWSAVPAPSAPAATSTASAASAPRSARCKFTSNGVVLLVMCGSILTDCL